MNDNTNPPKASPSSPSRHPCFAVDPNVAALNVFVDDEHSHLLPYAQFMHAELGPNPALETKPDAPPDRLLIRFAGAEVVVPGSGLQQIERSLQNYELKFVKSDDRRYAGTSPSHVAAISLSLTKETP